MIRLATPLAVLTERYSSKDQTPRCYSYYCTRNKRRCLQSSPVVPHPCSAPFPSPPTLPRVVALRYEGPNAWPTRVTQPPLCQHGLAQSPEQSLALPMPSRSLHTSPGTPSVYLTSDPSYLSCPRWTPARDAAPHATSNPFCLIERYCQRLYTDTLSGRFLPRTSVDTRHSLV